jgi:hypothetical protein
LLIPFDIQDAIGSIYHDIIADVMGKVAIQKKIMNTYISAYFIFQASKGVTDLIHVCSESQTRIHIELLFFKFEGDPLIRDIRS